MNNCENGRLAEWLLGIERQLKGLREKPPAAYEPVFRELHRWQSQLEGPQGRAVELLWTAAVAYLMLDLAAGDALRRQAARCLRNPEWA